MPQKGPKVEFLELMGRSQNRITNPLLLIALGLLVGGFMAIQKFAPEPMQVGEHVVTQKSLYTAFVYSPRLCGSLILPRSLALAKLRCLIPFCTGTDFSSSAFLSFGSRHPCRRSSGSSDRPCSSSSRQSLPSTLQNLSPAKSDHHLSSPSKGTLL